MTTAILDAAQSVFEVYGARRANLEDVARAAKVSKSTLYRAFKTKEQLLDAVLARALRDFFAQLGTVASGLTPREAVVECFSHGIRLTREVPLLARLFETEPEAIMRATDPRSYNRLLLLSTSAVAVTLRRTGANMPEEELQEVSELMLRLAYTYLISPDGGLDLNDEDKVRDYAHRYLAPLVH